MDKTGSVLLLCLAVGCLVTGFALGTGNAAGAGGSGTVVILIGLGAALAAGLVNVRHLWHLWRRRPGSSAPRR